MAEQDDHDLRNTSQALGMFRRKAEPKNDNGDVAALSSEPTGLSAPPPSPKAETFDVPPPQRTAAEIRPLFPSLTSDKSHAPASDSDLRQDPKLAAGEAGAVPCGLPACLLGGTAGVFAKPFGAFRCTAVEISPRYTRAARASGGKRKAAEHAFSEGMTRDDLKSRGKEGTDALRATVKRVGGGKYACILAPLSAAALKTMTLPEMTNTELEREAEEDPDYWRAILGEKDPAEYDVQWHVAKRDALRAVMTVNVAAVRRDDAEFFLETARAAGLRPAVLETKQTALLRAAQAAEGGERGCAVLHVSPEENHFLRHYEGHISCCEILIEDWEQIALTGGDSHALAALAERYAKEARALSSDFERETQAPAPRRLLMSSDIPLAPAFIRALTEALPEYSAYALTPAPSGNDKFVAEPLSGTDDKTLSALCARPLSSEAATLAAAGRYAGEDDSDALPWIRLNLLPTRRLLASGVRRRAAADAAAYAFAAVAALALFALSAALWGREKMTEAKLQEAKIASAEYPALMEEAKFLKTAADRLKDAETLPERLPLNQEQLLSAVRDVHTHIPDRVWLTKFEFTSPAQIVLSGEADFDSDIVAFQERLSAQKAFESASLSMMQSREEKQESIPDGEALPGGGEPEGGRRLVKTFTLRGMLPGGAAYEAAKEQEKAAKRAAKNKGKGGKNKDKKEKGKDKDKASKDASKTEKDPS